MLIHLGTTSGHGAPVLEGAVGELARVADVDTGDTPAGAELEGATAVVVSGAVVPGAVVSGAVVLGLVPGLVPGAVVLGPVVSVSVTGQIVVERAMVEVITVVERAGQLVTVDAQLVIVTSVVVNTVEVVYWGDAAGVVTTVVAGDEPGPVDTGDTPVGTVPGIVTVDAEGVVEGEDTGAVLEGAVLEGAGVVVEGAGAVVEEAGAVVEDAGAVVEGEEEGTEVVATVVVVKVVGGAEAALVGDVAVSVAVTGQIVVEIAIVLVMTVVEWAGQLVTVGAQLVMVTSVVVKTVEVTKDDPEGVVTVEGGVVVPGAGVELCAVVGLSAGVLEPFAGVVETAPGVEEKPDLGPVQSNPIPQMPKPHSDTELLSEIWKLTEVAPPH